MNDQRSEQSHAKADCWAAGEKLQKRAWRPHEWRREVPIGRSKLNEMIASGEIESVKYDGMRLIMTPPSVFLERLRNR